MTTAERDERVDRAIRLMAARRSDANTDEDDLIQLGRIAAWRVFRNDPGATTRLAIHAAKMAMLAARGKSLGWLAGKAAASIRPGGGREFMDRLAAVDLWRDVAAVLNPGELEAVTYRFLHGASAAETAKTVGRTKPTIEGRYRQALVKLRAALSESYGDEYGGPSVPLRRPDAYRHHARRSGPAGNRGRRRSCVGSTRAAINAKIKVIEAARDEARSRNEE